MTLSNIDLFLLLLPMISGYAMSIFCGPSKSAGSLVKFRPPAWVFGVVWPILYLLLGFAWIKSKEFSILYFILITLLNSWLIVYGCQKNKKLAIYIILLSILTLFYILVSVNISIKYYLIPLIIWLFFAFLLSLFEYQSK